MTQYPYPPKRGRRDDRALCAGLRTPLVLGIVASLLVSALGLVFVPRAAAATRSFSTRFTMNVTGDVEFVGNTIMSCATGVGTCTTAQAGTNTGNANNNNGQTMQYVDADGIGSTFSSSSATLAMPTGSTVLFAGLYWGGYSSDVNRNTVKFKEPGSGTYTTLTADQLDSGTSDYQGFKNVTSTVRTAGNGTYWAADVYSTPNATNMYAGWTLVVAYQDPNGVTRNLTVFDGYQYVSNGNPQTINVSGFLTPPTGAVNTKLGVVAYEGDRGTTGDQLSLNSTVMSDSANPSDNFFNSTVSNLGSLAGSKSPNYANQLGYDADIISVPNAGNAVIANNATSASIVLSSTGDVFYPGVVVFVTDLYAPKMAMTKTASDVNGGTTRPGDEIEYTLTVTNSGDDAATSNVLTDNIPVGTTFVPGSLQIVSGANAGPKTDATSDDQAQYAAGTVTFFLGTGANGSSGGQLDRQPSPGNPTTTVLRFRVRIDETVGDGVVIANTANLTYTALTLGTSSTASGVAPSTGSGAVVNRADLAITKTLLSASAVPGQTVNYEIVVTNTGATSNSVANAPVQDLLPAALSNATWTCAASAGSSCDNVSGTGNIVATVDLQPAGTATFNLTATVSAAASGQLANTATVTAPSGVTDSDTTNNSATATTTLAPTADLSVTKTNGATSTAAGASVTYTIVAANAGPSNVTGAIVSDPVPSASGGVSWTCVGAAGGICPASGTGNLSTAVDLPSGASTTFTVTYLTDPSAVGPSLVNTASITPPVGVVDPTPGNNSGTDTDTFSRRADLVVAKSHPSGPVRPGTNVSYTITVTNNGPSLASTAGVVDTLPAGMSFVSMSSPTWTCPAAPTGQTASCTATDLPIGSSTITVVAAIAPDATGTLNNTASVSSPDDPTSSNNSITDPTPLSPLADLAIGKSHSPATLVAGTNVTYTLTVANAGPSSAAGATVTDVLPNGLTFVSATAPSGWTCSGTSTVSCNGASVPVGTVQITVVAAVDPNYAGATLDNSATLASSTPDPDSGDLTGTDSAPVSRVADLEATKAHTATVIAGQPASYTITVRNLGPSSSNATLVTDPLPPELTGASWTCLATAGSSCPATGSGTLNNTPVNLAPNGVATFTLTASVSASAGVFNNTVIVTPPAGVTDPDPNDNNGADTSAPLLSADLSISKTDGVNSAVPGTSTTYTIVAANAGPSSVTGVPITDTLPAALQGASWTCVGAGGGVCNLSSGSGSIATTVDLPAGSTTTFTLTAGIDPRSSGSLANSATIGVPAGVSDVVPGNNSSTDTDTLTSRTDLSITKTDGASTAVPGTSTSYSIVVRNDGPSFASGATVSDVLGGIVTGATWTCTATGSGSNCPASGTGDISATVDLAPAGEATFVLTGTIPSTASGSIDNTATVTPGVGATDPNPLNDSATDTSTLQPRAAVTITKTNATTTPVPGQDVTYVVTVTNAGPSAAPGVAVTDTVPASLSNVTWTCAASSGSSCGAATGSGSLATTADLASTGTVTYTILARVDAAATGTLANTATAVVPPSIIDGDLTDNLATDSDTLVPTADISITKTDNRSPAGAVAGEQVTYTVTVRNSGPSRAVGVTVTDALPPSLVGASWLCTATSGSSCGSAAGLGSVLTTVTLDPAGQAQFTITATLDANATGSLINTATVDYPPSITDPTPGVTQATDTLAIVRKADLKVTKTDGATTSTPGLPITYTIVVTNDGPSAVAGASVSDPMPSQLLNATWTCVASPGSACNAGGGNGSIATTVDLTATGTATFTVTALVNPVAAPGSLVNTATATTPPGTTDPDASNSSATDTNTIVPIADLSLTKTDGMTSVVAGTSVSYTITVTNNGPSAVLGASVVDALGTSLIDASWTCTVAPVDAPSACPQATGTGGINTTVDLAAQATAVFLLSATVNPSFRGTLTNTARATTPAGTGDPVPTNNAETDSTAVTSSADVSITKTNGATESAPGQVVDYTVTVANAGPSTATAVHVTDPLVAPYLSSTWTCAAAGGATCPAGSGTGALDQTASALVPNGTLTYTVSSKIDPAERGTATNTANVSSGDPDPDSLNDSASDTDTLVPKADLRIVKTDNAAAIIPGLNTSYTITAFNDGPSDVVGASVADTMPTTLGNVTWTCVEESGSKCATASGTGDIATKVDLVSGSKVVFTVKAAVSPSGLGKLTNKATVTSPADVPDPELSNNESTDESDLTPHVNLRVTKTDNADTQTPGKEISYTIQVTNDGPSAAMGTRVTDDAPKTLLDPTWVCTGSAGTICNGGTAALSDAIVDLPVNATAIFTFRAKIDPEATGVLENTVNVVPGPGVTDINPGDNTAKDSSKLIADADLEVTKTDDTDVAIPGRKLTYTMTVTNTGLSASGPVKVSDPLPQSLKDASWKCSISGHGKGSCAAGAGTGSIATTVKLSPGQVATFELAATVDPDTEAESIVNTVKADLSEAAVDPTPGPNEASDTDNVQPETDLKITKSHTGGDLEAGGSATYTITVTNAGPSTARGVKIEDPLPAGLLDATWTCAASSGSACEASGTGSIATTVTVKAGGTVTFTLKAKVDVEADAEIVNVANLVKPEKAKDLSTDDDRATDTAKVIRKAEVSITKTDGRGYAVQGRRNTYTIVVANAGPAAAKNVRVVDDVPKAMSGVTWICEVTSGKGACSEDAGSGDLDTTVSLSPDSTIEFKVSGIVSKTALADLINTATAKVEDGVIDEDLSNNSSTDRDVMWKEWLKNPPKDTPPQKQRKAKASVESPDATADTEPDVSPNLALTGSAAIDGLLYGLGLIGLGVGFVRFARRRRRRV